MPEVISEGLKFKNFMGGCTQTPPTECTVTCSPFAPPPQILPKYYFAPPCLHFSK